MQIGKNPAKPLVSVLNVLEIGGSYMAGGVGATVARQITSPTSVLWLSSMPHTPGSFTRHLGWLAAMSEGDESVRSFVKALGF